VARFKSFCRSCSEPLAFCFDSCCFSAVATGANAAYFAREAVIDYANNNEKAAAKVASVAAGEAAAKAASDTGGDANAQASAAGYATSNAMYEYSSIVRDNDDALGQAIVKLNNSYNISSYAEAVGDATVTAFLVAGGDVNAQTSIKAHAAATAAGAAADKLSRDFFNGGIILNNATAQTSSAILAATAAATTAFIEAGGDVTELTSVAATTAGAVAGAAAAYDSLIAGGDANAQAAAAILAAGVAAAATEASSGGDATAQASAKAAAEAAAKTVADVATQAIANIDAQAVTNAKTIADAKAVKAGAATVYTNATKDLWTGHVINGDEIHAGSVFGTSRATDATAYAAIAAYAADLDYLDSRKLIASWARNDYAAKCPPSREGCAIDGLYLEGTLGNDIIQNGEMAFAWYFSYVEAASDATAEVIHDILRVLEVFPEVEATAAIASAAFWDSDKNNTLIAATNATAIEAAAKAANAVVNVTNSAAVAVARVKEFESYDQLDYWIDCGVPVAGIDCISDGNKGEWVLTNYTIYDIIHKHPTIEMIFK